MHLTISISLFRAPSPIPKGPHSMAAAMANPLESLPHTVFPQQKHHYLQQHPQSHNQPQQQSRPDQHINFPPPAPPRNCFSPQVNRDFYLDPEDEASAIQNQVSRRWGNTGKICIRRNKWNRSRENEIILESIFVDFTKKSELQWAIYE